VIFIFFCFQCELNLKKYLQKFLYISVLFWTKYKNLYLTIFFATFFSKEVKMPRPKMYTKKVNRKRLPVGTVAWVAEKKTRMVLTDEEKKLKVNYSFTLNNWTEQHVDDLARFFEENKKTVRYMIYGKEVGEKGTPHLQGHIDLRQGQTTTALQKTLQKYNIKVTLKYMVISAAHSREYCKKDGEFTEFGTPPAQGTRNDLVACMEYCKEYPHTPRIELFEMFSSQFARYSSFLERYRILCYTPETLNWTDPPNVFIYGKPGVGKSKRFQSMTSLYRKDTNKWWCGYDQHSNVLIEDVDPTTMYRMGRFIKVWADRYPFTAQTKGSAMVIRPQRVFITSNYHPEMLFSATDLPAIQRRFVIEEM